MVDLSNCFLTRSVHFSHCSGLIQCWEVGNQKLLSLSFLAKRTTLTLLDLVLLIKTEKTSLLLEYQFSILLFCSQFQRICLRLVQDHHLCNPRYAHYTAETNTINFLLWNLFRLTTAASLPIGQLLLLKIWHVMFSFNFILNRSSWSCGSKAKYGFL